MPSISYNWAPAITSPPLAPVESQKVHIFKDAAAVTSLDSGVLGPDAMTFTVSNVERGHTWTAHVHSVIDGVESQPPLIISVQVPNLNPNDIPSPTDGSGEILP